MQYTVHFYGFVVIWIVSSLYKIIYAEIIYAEKWKLHQAKNAFEYAQNAQVQIILHMRTVSSFLSINKFCSIQWLC